MRFSGHFAKSVFVECNDHITRQIRHTQEPIKSFCRVMWPRHLAKKHHLPSGSGCTRQTDWQRGPLVLPLPSASFSTSQRDQQMGPLELFLSSTSSVATRQRPRHHHLASWQRLFFTEYQVVLGKVFAMRPTKKYTAKKPLLMYSSTRLICRESHECFLSFTECLKHSTKQLCSVVYKSPWETDRTRQGR